MSQHIALSRLTASQAKLWLVSNDGDASQFWLNVFGKKALIDAVEDNLANFGIKTQSGSVIITSNNERFKYKHFGKSQ